MPPCYLLKLILHDSKSWIFLQYDSLQKIGSSIRSLGFFFPSQIKHSCVLTSSSLSMVWKFRGLSWTNLSFSMFLLVCGALLGLVHIGLSIDDSCHFALTHLYSDMSSFMNVRIIQSETFCSDEIKYLFSKTQSSGLSLERLEHMWFSKSRADLSQ